MISRFAPGKERGRAINRAALLALCALSFAGCEFARTSVPYGPGQGTASADWDAARLACASDGRVPVEQYQWAVVRREAALRCELPGEMMPGAAPTSR